MVALAVRVGASCERSKCGVDFTNGRRLDQLISFLFGRHLGGTIRVSTSEA